MNWQGYYQTSADTRRLAMFSAHFVLEWFCNDQGLLALWVLYKYKYLDKEVISIHTETHEVGTDHTRMHQNDIIRRHVCTIGVESLYMEG